MANTIYAPLGLRFILGRKKSKKLAGFLTQNKTGAIS